ncbi:MAG TPA: plastocyanin/azurin family copper-binding protein [Patescibacteria group bacterium]|nr:plastocyanin/azurin family copper-binding protein [Patescibacteria group bacterium]
MRPVARGIATLATAIALAACSGNASSAPTSAAGTQAAPGSQAPAATTAGSAVCADSTGTTTVEATVGGFTWGPVSAKVGDVITWTNTDAAPHRVGLDDGSCTMSGDIAGGGGKASLVFSVAGTYPFHCTIHSSMKGTITIS